MKQRKTLIFGSHGHYDALLKLAEYTRDQIDVDCFAPINADVRRADRATIRFVRDIAQANNIFKQIRWNHVHGHGLSTMTTRYPREREAIVIS